ncbi:DUF928 domain-containing protein [Scytonema sp. NUACC26]|uniref:DUF928 domain-containing protein n=1 Tax=Scytonema sp. NUACC26 TaxID=3140176 RepID=UPI0034DB93AB
MNKQTLAKSTIVLSSILLLSLTHSLFFLSSVQAQNTKSRPNLSERVKRFFFGTRPGGVAKGRKRGGAVRGPCRQLSQQIIALVPSTDNGVPFIEQTISQRPTFWFYIPRLPIEQVKAEFLLLNEQGKEIGSEIFPLRSQPGIIRLQMPSKILPLEPNKTYRWAFSAICNPEDRSADVTVNGWLKHTAADSNLNQRLKSTSGREQVFVYTDSQLWYETLTKLAELRQQNPQDVTIQTDWANVLRLMGLPEDAPKTWTTYPLPSNADTTSR